MFPNHVIRDITGKNPVRANLEKGDINDETGAVPLWVNYVSFQW